MIGSKSRFKYIEGTLINNYNINSRALKGQEAGTTRKDGYKVVRVNKKGYLVHRLIWEHFRGPIPKGFYIDHIDRNPSNNKLENLRLVTNQENAFNTSASGAYYDKRRDKWYSQIRKSGQRRCLGTFNTKDEAEEAYTKAKRDFHKIEERIHE